MLSLMFNSEVHTLNLKAFSVRRAIFVARGQPAAILQLLPQLLSAPLAVRH